MDVESAVETLAFLTETEEEQAALRFLAAKAQQADLGDVASSKQIYFINSMAQAAGVDLETEMEGLGINMPENPRALPKKDASKLIKEFIRRGYKDMLPQRN